MTKTRQHETPSHFNHYWRRSGLPGETAHGGEVGYSIGYICREGRADKVKMWFFDGCELLCSPWELFPATEAQIAEFKEQCHKYGTIVPTGAVEQRGNDE